MIFKSFFFLLVAMSLVYAQPATDEFDSLSQQTVSDSNAIVTEIESSAIDSIVSTDSVVTIDSIAATDRVPAIDTLTQVIDSTKTDTIAESPSPVQTTYMCAPGQLYVKSEKTCYMLPLHAHWLPYAKQGNDYACNEGYEFVQKTRTCEQITPKVAVAAPRGYEPEETEEDEEDEPEVDTTKNASSSVYTYEYSKEPSPAKELSRFWNPSIQIGAKLGQLWNQKKNVDDTFGDLNIGAESLWGGKSFAWGFAVTLERAVYKRSYGRYEADYVGVRSDIAFVLLMNHFFVRPYVTNEWWHSCELKNISTLEYYYREHSYGFELGFRVGKYWTHPFSADFFAGIEKNVFEDVLAKEGYIWFVGLRFNIL